MLRITLFIVLCLLCVGCVSVAKPYPEKQFFVIEANYSGSPLQKISNSVLAISEFKVSSAFSGQGLVYQQGEHRYTSDFYNEFFVPLSSITTDATRDWFEASGMFEHVSFSDSRIEANYQLEGSINAIYGDFTSSPKAVVKIQLLLLQTEEAGIRLVSKGNYQESVEIADQSATALVKGWNVAFNKILQNFTSDIQKRLQD